MIQLRKGAFKDGFYFNLCFDSRHLNNLHVTTQWMLEDLRKLQEDQLELTRRLISDNAQMRQELVMLGAQVNNIQAELASLEKVGDLKAEILLEDINFSLVTMADDLVDRVGKEAEARERESMFSERVKKAVRELDSGLGLPVGESTPRKDKKNAEEE